MNRRDFVVRLAQGAAITSGLAACAADQLTLTAGSGLTSIDSSRAKDGLVGRAARRGIVYGCATSSRRWLSDSAFAHAVVAEGGIVSPEWELKWLPLRPALGVFDFTLGDRLVKLATAQQLPVRGHTLVWHLDVPDWVPAYLSTVDRARGEALLHDHITTVVKRYSGRVSSWDVVNEPLCVSSGCDGLRNSLWRRAIGDEYIASAFHAAANSDPTAQLVLNEYYLEGDGTESVDRRAAMLGLLERLLGQGVPIHALGVQAHLNGQNMSDDFVAFRSFLAEVAGMGLAILVTELDVQDDLTNSDEAARDDRVGDVYSSFLAAALDEPAVSTVVTWGLSDRYTWLNYNGARADGQPVRPLPLDAKLARKRAWDAMASAFDNAPERNVADATLQRIPSDREVDLPGNRAVPADL